MPSASCSIEAVLREDRAPPCAPPRHRPRAGAPRVRPRRPRDLPPSATASPRRRPARACSRPGGPLGLPAELKAIAERLTGVPPIPPRVAAALVDDPPPFKRDGGFVRLGYRAELDEALRLREDSPRSLAGLDATSKRPASRARSLPQQHPRLFRRGRAEQRAPPAQPAAVGDLPSPPDDGDAVRFSTAELAEIEGRIASAAERALATEQEVFATLANAVDSEAPALSNVAAALAELDHTAALATLAEAESYVRPRILDGEAFEIRGGRHPVVEQALRAAKAGPFIENDCVLGRAPPEEPPAGFDEGAEARIWLVTGPNMAGKSTFLRQNALIAVMAQMGSYVPARSAAIGIVDRSSRASAPPTTSPAGARRSWSRWSRPAGILNQATRRSLVILDEIGRGTATFDGLSIAWATVEYLHDVCQARALFATHYHELTALGRPARRRRQRDDRRQGMARRHRLPAQGRRAADRSYGIQVAKLAGLPSAVKRAGEVLRRLESESARPARTACSTTCPLLGGTAQGRRPRRPRPLEVEKALAHQPRRAHPARRARGALPPEGTRQKLR